ncbi:MAG: LysR family transcriptional regulator [Oceanospirillaceae bacterium]
MKSINKYDVKDFIFEKGIALDWNALKIFIAIYQHRTLVNAAKSLGMSHTTIYRRLNEFEAEVGRLFERLNGQYELTELGEEMMVHAQKVNLSVEDIERNIAGKDTQPKGIVKITAPSSFAYRDLPEHIAKLSMLYPDIQLELLVTELELSMTNRKADIAIRVTSSPPEHLVGREIRRIKWGVYANSEYETKYGKLNDLSDLANHRLIGATGLLSNHPAYLWLEKKNSASIGLRTDDLVAMSALANTGHWLAILPEDLANKELQCLLKFDPIADNQLWILTHPDLRKVERIKVVMKYLALALSEPKSIENTG